MKIIEYGDDLSRLIDRSSLDFTQALDTSKEIIEAVKARGDEALEYYSRKFDDPAFSVSDLEISNSRVEGAYGLVDEEVIEGIRHAKENIWAYHESQLKTIRNSWSIRLVSGIQVGEKTTPIESVGCYIPGGKAPLISTVLMTVIPAKLAGVERILVVSPPRIHPAILVACDLCGIDEIFQVGGAQAIAALAWGTETIRPVVKVVGPGNRYVTAAKMLVFGRVDIDMPAGPSEILIIADENANPEYITWDILSQAEHTGNEHCVLVTDSRELAEKVVGKIEERARSLERSEMIVESLKNSSVVIVDSMREAVEFANAFAPEHLEIMVKNPDRLAGRIKNAGAIFIGDYAPVAAGDYASGANHVLPTGGAARFSSQLSVRDFLKTSSIQKIDRKGLEVIAKTIKIIANAEGLEAHRRSIEERL
jgi:histidinol dehydrogenase